MPTAAAASPIVADDSVDSEVDLPTRPPPPPAGARGESDFEVDIDVQEPAQERSVEIDMTLVDGPARDAFERRESLVAADSVAPKPIAAPVPAVEMTALREAVTLPASRDVEGASQPPPEEIGEPGSDDEEAPASSRRPVISEPEERLAEMAFGTGEPQPPRHTPPPESGRLPASPVVEFDPDVTGVRDAAPKASEPAPQSPPPELVPQAMRASLVSSEHVVDVVGAAQRFAPATLMELLDASLAL